MQTLRHNGLQWGIVAQQTAYSKFSIENGVDLDRLDAGFRPLSMHLQHMHF